MQDLMYELMQARSDLDKSIMFLRKNGTAYAQAEHDYQVIKSQTVLVMKSNGCTATEIQMSVKGQPQVAEAMLKRDVAKVTYEANQEHINVKKLEIRVIENQIAREWNSNG